MTFRLRGPSLLLLGIAATAWGAPDTFFLGNGSDGARTISSWETVNTYAQVVEPLIPGDVSFEVEPDASFNVTANDLILVVQSTGVIPTPGTNGTNPLTVLGDAGNYELARVQSVTAGSTATRVTLTLTQPLWRSYASLVTQVVFVPEFTTVTVNAGQGIYAPVWNGQTGGVVAFLATGALVNHGNIESWGSGFRGGLVNATNDSATACVGEDLAAPKGAGKGEGLGTGYPTASGRGYRANGGGGGICQNSGGGGGGGVGQGGPGGNSTSGTLLTGGRGGAGVSYLPSQRLLFGGGGGAGQQDNSSGGRGGTGAGVVFIRAASLSGGGWIYSDAEEGQDSNWDGAGGGGGGGTVVVRLTGAAACGSVTAWGGTGGSVTGMGTPGPGGGGGGGSVLVQGSGWSALNCVTSVGAGANGDNTVGANGANYGDPGTEIVETTAFALPAAPTLTAPAAITNDNTPTISGTVAEAFPALQALVFIDGVWRSTVTANASEVWSYVSPTLSDGLHTALAHTQKQGIHSVASSTRSFTVDTVTPGTQFTATPPASSNDDTPTFGFSKVEAVSTTAVTFQCALDGAAYAACTSPLTLTPLLEGSHTLLVRARDAANNVDATPASHTWTVDLTPPDGNCTNEPPALTNQRVWSFPLTSTEAGSTFRCKLDGAAGFTACSNPYVTPSLGDGAHRLEVQAVDAAGNVDASPFVSDWTVDGTPPQTTLLTAPPVFTTTTRYSFEFGSSEPGSFLCSLDGAPFSPCTSPQDPTLADGPHTFVVYAADTAGNLDDTPESYSWTIDTVTPDTQIDSGPQSVTNQTSAVFVFSSPEAGVAFECSVDGAVFAACVSPLTVSSLGVGTHFFQVRARDSAGNQDATVAQQVWTVVLDADGDGLEDSEELLVGTSPDRRDTDGDGLSDFVEVRTGGSEPLDGDSDDDGLQDGMEDLNADGIQQPSESSTRNRDSDGDGLSDGVERGLSTPQSPDTDLALFVADAQPSTTTDPARVDTDGDGLEDGVEDLNRDGAKAATETDPARADSDADGIGDGVELRGANPTDPLNPDSDQDSLLDGEEDLDHDGEVDPEETDPNAADTDQGGVLDGVERQGTSNPLDGNDDYGVRGGGCSSTGGGPLLWLGTIVLAVGLRRGRRLTGLLLAGASSAVLAQPVLSTAIDLQQLKPAPGADAILGLHGAGVDPHLGWRAGLFVSYGANPLTLVVTANDQPVRQVISGQATADLQGAISLWNLLEVGLALPVSYQLSEGLSLGSATTAIAPAGVGDLRLVPKVKLLELSGLRLAAVAEVAAPTGAADAFLGSGGFSARPRLVADWAPLPVLRVLLNGGANLRSPQRLLNLVVGHEVTYGAAVEGALPWAGLELAAGVAGAVGLSPGSAANHPLELLASARVPLGRHFELTVGGGAGLGSGYGTPSFRMLAAFSYQSARGVALELPPPPAAVAPVDPDPDRDGIPNTVDECDEKPETRNDYRDEDGCPDTLPGENTGPVVKDQDKDGVLDDQDLCPGLPGEAEEDGCPPDDDNDGIVNPLDLCPTRKEVINGFEDEDGCPDKLPRQNTRRRR